MSSTEEPSAWVVDSSVLIAGLLANRILTLNTRHYEDFAPGLEAVSPQASLGPASGGLPGGIPAPSR